ncbi:MAG: TIGR01212 family radical SAM protein [Oscillospiraceae bacterium]|nr:TIGR01212 family radical SAM protein [Oscillospiraceae bacterium]
MNTVKDNPFQFSCDNKRYRTYSHYLKERFGNKVFKVSLNLGLSCPNRDGKKGFGGCIYCSEKLSGDFGGNPAESLEMQFEKVRLAMEKKWEGGKCIPYFQAGTNTYADISFLKEAYEKALSFDNVVGLAIATRADCITEEIADLLCDISKRTYLVVELGLQTIHDSTAELINRCHTYEEFLMGYRMLKERNINVCIHLIDGLPGETKEMMLQTAKEVGRLSPHAVKLHLLHVIRGTRLFDMYEKGLVRPLELEEYVDIVCDQLELFPQETVIERVTGDGAKDTLAAPMWSLKKLCVMNEIDKEMGRRNSFQGRLFSQGQ